MWRSESSHPCDLNLARALERNDWPETPALFHWTTPQDCQPFCPTWAAHVLSDSGARHVICRFGMKNERGHPASAFAERWEFGRRSIVLVWFRLRKPNTLLMSSWTSLQDQCWCIEHDHHQGLQLTASKRVPIQASHWLSGYLSLHSSRSSPLCTK